MVNPVQTSGFKSAPNRAYPGMLAEGPHDIGSFRCDEVDGIPPGLLLIRSDNGDFAAIVPPTPVLDADGVLTTHAASSSGAQNLTTSDWNGALVGERFPLPVKLEIVLNSHANWDATTGSITYPNENGELITESLTIPDGGNTTLKTSGYASGLPTALSIPQQSGTAATYTVGVTAEATLDGGYVLGVSIREHKGRVIPVFDDNEIWDYGQELGGVRFGRIVVQMESAFTAGTYPYVRLIAGVGEQRGRFRGDTDSGDAVIFRRARLLNSGSSGDFATLAVRLY